MKKRSGIRWATLFVPVVMLVGTAASVLINALHIHPIPKALGNFYFLCVPTTTVGFGFDNDFGWPAWPFALAALLMAGLYLLCWLRDWRKATLGLFIADAAITIGLAAMFLSRVNAFIQVFWIPVIFHAIGFALLGIDMKKRQK